MISGCLYNFLVTVKFNNNNNDNNNNNNNNSNKMAKSFYDSYMWLHDSYICKWQPFRD